jgi:hypothetical protein
LASATWGGALRASRSSACRMRAAASLAQPWRWAFRSSSSSPRGARRAAAAVGHRAKNARADLVARLGNASSAWGQTSSRSARSRLSSRRSSRLARSSSRAMARMACACGLLGSNGRWCCRSVSRMRASSSASAGSVLAPLVRVRPRYRSTALACSASTR